MSDLEKINPEDDMNLLDLASHQPKYVDEKTRSFKGITQDEWYEIVQWLQLRMDDASKWTMTKIDVMYSDLKGYTKGDVFFAVQKIYEQGRSKAPDGGMILAKLKELNIPKVRQPEVSNSSHQSGTNGLCDTPGYSCLFVDSAWFSDDYGNWHFQSMCTANGTKGVCEARVSATPSEHEVRTQPARSNKGELYATMCKMKTLNDDMKRQVWKTYEKYPEGNLEEVIKQYGKREWYG